MNTTQDHDEPRDRPFNPFRIAETDKALEVVADVLHQLQAYEDLFKLRQRARRPADKKIFEQVVEALVCDLAHRELTKPGGWLAVPLSKQVLGRKDRYGSPVMSKTLPEVVERLASPEMSFVEFKKGYHDHPFKETERNRQSVIRAGKRLRTRINDSKLGFSDLGRDKHGETIILRNKGRVSSKSVNVPYEDTEQTHRYREEVSCINDWLEGADIRFDNTRLYRAQVHRMNDWLNQGGGALDIRDRFGDTKCRVDTNSRSLERIFNNGSFEQGGRLYGGFWIPLSQHQRLNGIVINGSSVASLDFGQMAARTLYGMAGATPHFEDAYRLPGWEKYRDSVKTVFNAMLHAPTPHTRLPRGSRNQLPRGVGVEEVTAAIMAYHSPIKDYFYSAQGMEVMFKESQIMVSILQRLMSEGVVALPIHDAVIVPEKDVETTKLIMLEVFKQHSGGEGLVGVEYGEHSYKSHSRDYTPSATSLPSPSPPLNSIYL